MENKNILFSSLSPSDLEELICKCVKKELQDFTPAPPQPDTEFISRKQAASILGISLPTLGLWSKTGVIPSYRICSRVRYKLDEVKNSVNKVQTIKYGRT